MFLFNGVSLLVYNPPGPAAGPGIPKNSLRIRKNHPRNLENAPETSGTPPNTSETPPNTCRTPREYPKMIRKSPENVQKSSEKRTDGGQIWTSQSHFFRRGELPGPRNSRSQRQFIACQPFCQLFWTLFFLKVGFFFSLKMST